MIQIPVEGVAFEVRDFRSEDAFEVSRLARVAWEHTYADIYSEHFIADFVDRFYSPSALEKAIPATERGEAQFLIATDLAQNIFGFCHAGFDKNRDLELYRIYVHPDVIGQGLGTLLLKRSEAFIARLGADRYHCYVHRLNELGKHFYKRCGFVHIPEQDSGDEWYLRKILT